MLRVSDLRHKDIINCVDGRRLGYIRDVDMDLNQGIIKAIIVPSEMRIFSLFGSSDDLIIPWEQIKKIGIDVILVELERVTPIRRFSSRYQEDLQEAQPLTLNRLPKGAASSPLDYDSDLEKILHGQSK